MVLGDVAEGPPGQMTITWAFLCLLLAPSAMAQEPRAEVKCKAEPMWIQHGNEKPRDMWSAECVIKVGDKQIFHKMFEPVLTVDEALAQIKQFIKKGQYKALRDAGYL